MTIEACASRVVEFGQDYGRQLAVAAAVVALLVQPGCAAPKPAPEVKCASLQEDIFMAADKVFEVKEKQIPGDRTGEREAVAAQEALKDARKALHAFRVNTGECEPTIHADLKVIQRDGEPTVTFDGTGSDVITATSKHKGIAPIVTILTGDPRDPEALPDPPGDPGSLVRTHTYKDAGEFEASLGLKDVLDDSSETKTIKVTIGPIKKTASTSKPKPQKITCTDTWPMPEGIEPHKYGRLLSKGVPAIRDASTGAITPTKAALKWLHGVQKDPVSLSGAMAAFLQDGDVLADPDSLRDGQCASKKAKDGVKKITKIINGATVKVVNAPKNAINTAVIKNDEGDLRFVQAQDQGLMGNRLSLLVRSGGYDLFMRECTAGVVRDGTGLTSLTAPLSGSCRPKKK